MTDETNDARVTPWDVVFGAPGFDTSLFDAIRDEAGSTPAMTPADLMQLPAAGALLRELLPEEPAGEAHRAAVRQVSAFVFHAFEFWRDGRNVYPLARDVVAPLLEREHEAEPWTFRTPRRAGYVQLPHQLVWARVAEDAAPEPLDGFFWFHDEDAARLELLLALGVRAGRPGLSLVELSVEAAPSLGQWLAADARPGARDFENVLPGGELQGYFALTTHAEVLKLAVLCFRALDG